MEDEGAGGEDRDASRPRPVAGRCLCGAVGFTVTPPTDFVAHCHCASCRLAHAAPLVTWTSVPVERFALLRGEAGVIWYASSETIEWGFCGRCGSSMFYRARAAGHPEAPRTDRMYVTVGSLDGPLDREPSEHVSYEERTVRVPDGLPKRRGKTSEPLPE